MNLNFFELVKNIWKMLKFGHQQFFRKLKSKSPLVLDGKKFSNDYHGFIIQFLLQTPIRPRYNRKIPRGFLTERLRLTSINTRVVSINASIRNAIKKQLVYILINQICVILRSIDWYFLIWQSEVMRKKVATFLVLIKM